MRRANRLSVSRRRLSIVFSVAAALLVVGCTRADAPNHPSPSASETSDGSVHATAGAVRVDGPPSSITPGGTVQVHIVSKAKPNLQTVPIGTVGPGVDVTVSSGASLSKPLTLSFPAEAPHPGWVPAVAHQKSDRSWELRAANWDGHTATLTTDQFSPNVLVWLDPGKVGDWIREHLVEFLTGRKPGPACRGNPHPWSNLEDHEDLVHACLTTNDSKTAGERAELRLTPNRGAYVEVTVPKGADYVWVKDQTSAFRSGLAKLTGRSSDRTVFLGPDDEMTIGWRKPLPGKDAEPTVSTEASATAMWLTLFEGTLDFDGFSVKGERSAGLMVLGGCVTHLGYDIFKSASGVPDALKCLAEGAGGNLSDPKTAAGAAADFLGANATRGELEEQTARLAKLSSGLAVAGHLIKVISVVTAVRKALLATYGTVSDQIQTLVLNGDGTTILVHLHTPEQVPLSKFAGQWIGHTRELDITTGGHATETVGNGCCDPVVDLELALSKPRVYDGTYIATATITKLVVHDQQTLGNRLRVGQSGTLKLRGGVITESIIGTNYCDERTQLAGVCGA